MSRDSKITGLIAQIRAAKTMAMRDSLFDQIIEAWEAAAPAQGGLSDALPVELTPRLLLNAAMCIESPGTGSLRAKREVMEKLQRIAEEMQDARLARLGGQVSDAADAARWRAVVASARIKPQGSAGLESPQPGNYAHMGLEMWTTHDRDYSASLLEKMDHQNALGRKWLTAYADVAVAAIQAQAGDAGGDRG